MKANEKGIALVPGVFACGGHGQRGGMTWRHLKGFL